MDRQLAHRLYACFLEVALARLTCGDVERETLKELLFQYSFDILLKIRLSDVAEQDYA